MIKRHRQAICVIIAALCAALLTAWTGEAASPRGGEQGTASGKLTIDQHDASLEYAYAMDQPNTFNKEKNDRALLITEKPLRHSVLKGIDDLLDATADIREGAWVFFKLDDKERPIYEMVYHPSLGKNRLIMSGLTRAVFSKEIYLKGRMAGAFRTKKAEEFMGHAYQLDVSVNTPVMKAPRPEPLPDARSGTALPAGGGEPADYYRALHEAIIARDIATFRALAPLEVKVKDLSDREILEGFTIMALLTPADVEVTSGFLNAAGDRAVLYLAGAIDGEKNYGTVEMVKAGGLWRVKKEHWGNTPQKP